MPSLRGRYYASDPEVARQMQEELDQFAATHPDFEIDVVQEAATFDFEEEEEEGAGLTQMDRGTPVVLFDIDMRDAESYPVFDAYALAYDPATKTITYAPLTCRECGEPVGKWDFQYANRGSRNAYGICANNHMTVVAPMQGSFEVV